MSLEQNKSTARQILISPTVRNTSIMPTILAILCTICWLGLIIYAISQWMMSGGEPTWPMRGLVNESTGFREPWSLRALSFTIYCYCTWGVAWGFFVFIPATVSGVLAILLRKRDNTPRRPPIILLLTSIILVVTYIFAFSY